jgi:4'-phosphopantetheinyl transferase
MSKVLQDHLCSKYFLKKNVRKIKYKLPMIRWLIQSVVDHPDLAAGRPPAGLLTQAESTQFGSLLSPQRRRDWLLGRWTAKRLIQTHIAATHGFCPPLGSFAIEQEPSGAPYAAESHTHFAPCRMPFALSISHSHGYAFCALCAHDTGQARLGVDIELVEPRTEEFAQEFFTAREQMNTSVGVLLVGTRSEVVMPSYERDLLMTATWSAKEAVLKATHVGLRIDPRSIECLPRPGCPRHWTPLQVKLATKLQPEEVGPLRVWWRVLENRLRPGTSFVLVIAAYRASL